MNPMQVIDKAVRDNLPILIRTADRKTYSGRPLHIGPRSVWLVSGNADLFVHLDAIVHAEICPLTPEGA